MTVAIETFKRYENKYLLDTRTMNQLQSQLAAHMELDCFNQNGQTYSISNIYFDTPDSYLIRNSLQKPSYKEKLRLRSYGVPGLETKVFLEIKKKYRGIVNKRRSSIKLADAYTFVADGKMPDEQPYHNRQVLREIAYILQTYELQPRLYLAYNRMAYFHCQDKNLRISFDTNILSRRTDLRLEAGDWGEQLLEPGQWLMEIKVADNLPFWLARLLSDLEIRPVSFSKYGSEYIHWLGEQQQESQIITFPALIPQTAGALWVRA
jgi:hypothetical protein